MISPDDPRPTDEPPHATGASALRSAVIGGSIGLALVAALFAWVLTRSTRDDPPLTVGSRSTQETAPPPRVEPPPSVERQTASRRLAGWPADPVDPLDVETARPRVFIAPITLAPPFDAIDAVLFDSSDTRVRLAGILGTARDEVCFDAERRRFACGLQARASLQNFMRGKTVVCRPLFGASERPEGLVEAHCSADGVSLSEHQVSAGYAFPVSADDKLLGAAQDKARAARVGVWVGPYVVPTTDNALADARAIRFGATRPTLAPPEAPEPKGN